jgi:hypothetical protein
VISVRTEQRVIAVCYGTLGVCVVGIALVWGGDDRYALTSLGLVWAGVTAFMAPSVVKMVRSARRTDAIERFPEALAGLLSTREIIVLLLKRVVVWAVAALAAGFVVIGADVGGPLGGLFLGTSTLSLIAALAIKRLEVTRQALLFRDAEGAWSFKSGGVLALPRPRWIRSPH